LAERPEPRKLQHRGLSPNGQMVIGHLTRYHPAVSSAAIAFPAVPQLTPTTPPNGLRLPLTPCPRGPLRRLLGTFPGTPVPGPAAHA
jgi:hypothetical protein